LSRAATRAARGLSSPKPTAVRPLAWNDSNPLGRSDFAADRNVRAPPGSACPQGE